MSRRNNTFGNLMALALLVALMAASVGAGMSAYDRVQRAMAERCIQAGDDAATCRERFDTEGER